MISVCQDFSTSGSVFAAKTYYISILLVLTKCKVNNGNCLQIVICAVRLLPSGRRKKVSCDAYGAGGRKGVAARGGKGVAGRAATGVG